MPFSGIMQLPYVWKTRYDLVFCFFVLLIYFAQGSGVILHISDIVKLSSSGSDPKLQI